GRLRDGPGRERCRAAGDGRGRPDVLRRGCPPRANVSPADSWQTTRGVRQAREGRRGRLDVRVRPALVARRDAVHAGVGHRLRGRRRHGMTHAAPTMIVTEQPRRWSAMQARERFRRRTKDDAADASERRPLALAPLEVHGAFQHDGFRLEYTEYGDSATSAGTVLLTHGILLSRRMHRPLARRLAREGFHVVTLDLLGHGGSDRPTESWRYSLTPFAEQVVGLLVHLDVEQAVVGGPSLGADVRLGPAVLARDRVHGRLVEMPVLDNAIFAGLLAFPPLLFAARFAPVTVNTVKAAAKRVPRGYIWVDVVADRSEERRVGKGGGDR